MAVHPSVRSYAQKELTQIYKLWRACFVHNTENYLFWPKNEKNKYHTEGTEEENHGVEGQKNLANG